MTVALESTLARAGLRVDPADFLALVEDAASKLSPPSPEPAHYFTSEQRAALVDVGLDLSAQAPDEPDQRARAVAAHAVLSEGSLTVSEAAIKLGVDDSRVRHRLAQRRLTGWKEPGGGWRMPAWQFTNSSVLPGLETVLHAVPDDQPALVVAAFMGTPQSDLVINERPATPRQWLLAGGAPELVAEIVAPLGTAS